MDLTSQLEFGSVEYFAEVIRRGVNGDGLMVSSYALGLVESIATLDCDPAADRVTRVRNVLDAATQVRDELR